MDFNVTKAGTSTAAVTSVLTLELIDAEGTTTPLETEFSFDPADPLAVTAAFLTVAGRVEWTFGRDLLIGGLYEPTGDGDVHVWPCLSSDGSAVVIIELCSPDGELLVQAGSRSIDHFVTSMLDSVPDGQESAFVNFDDEIASILGA